MADLISREALLATLNDLEATGGHKYYLKGANDVLHDIMPQILADAPAVDAEPVRHAEWIPWEHNGKASKHLVTCSGCRRYQWPKNDVLAFDRCPKCGAFMQSV